METTVSQLQHNPPVTVLKLAGDLNAATFEQFQSEAKKAIDAGAHNLLVDLSAVHYMSSAGMRALNQIFDWLSGSPEENAAIKKAVATGKVKSPHLKLLSPTPHVLEALKTAGFDMFLEIHHDLKQAIASF
jgi:ABC-type transporter Mla MlaB component